MVLPVLGLPTRATVRVVELHGQIDRSGQPGAGRTRTPAASRRRRLRRELPQADLDRVAERGEGEDFDLLAFEQAQLEEPLHQGRLAAEGLDRGPLAGLELVEGGHGGCRSRRADEDAGALAAAEAQPASGDLEQAGLPGWTTWTRQPWRMPSSASRPTQCGSPWTSSTTAHSPEASSSRGSSRLSTVVNSAGKAIET